MLYSIVYMLVQLIKLIVNQDVRLYSSIGPRLFKTTAHVLQSCPLHKREWEAPDQKKVF